MKALFKVQSQAQVNNNLNKPHSKSNNKRQNQLQNRYSHKLQNHHNQHPPTKKHKIKQRKAIITQFLKQNTEFTFKPLSFFPFTQLTPFGTKPSGQNKNSKLADLTINYQNNATNRKIKNREPIIKLH